jgi:hypothetical protein
MVLGSYILTSNLSSFNSEVSMLFHSLIITERRCTAAEGHGEEHPERMPAFGAVDMIREIRFVQCAAFNEAKFPLRAVSSLRSRGSRTALLPPWKRTRGQIPSLDH